VASLGVSQDRIYSVGTCRLCQSERELRRSHVIPEFLYGASYDEKHRLLLVPGTADEKPSLEQKGLRERLFCQECETRLSDYERYARHVMFETDAFPLTDEPKRIVVHGVDYRRFKLFQMSLLWRAGVSSLVMFNKVQLGPHEERIRLALLNDSPGDYFFYPCILLEAPAMPKLLERAITPPIPFRFEGHKAYRFSIGRLFLGFPVSSNTQQVVVPAAVISAAGDLPILKDIDGSFIPLIREMFAQFVKLAEIHKLGDDT